MRAVVFACACLMPVAVMADTLPTPVKTVRDEMVEGAQNCRTARGTIPKMLGKDRAFVISAELMGCEGISGSAGYPVAVMVLANGQWTVLYNGYAQAWKVKGNMIELALHGGGDCGTAGADTCTVKGTWNGTSFDHHYYVTRKGKLVLVK